MGCSKGAGSNCCCCPSGQIFQEQICGNFNDGGDVLVWSAPAGDYFEGTFEIFNSAGSAVAVTGTITTAAGDVIVGPVPPGYSISSSALRPTAFTITAPVGTNGKYCITLYKNVLA